MASKTRARSSRIAPGGRRLTSAPATRSDASAPTTRVNGGARASRPDTALHEQIGDLERMIASAMRTAGEITRQATPRGKYTPGETTRLMAIADLVLQVEHRIKQLRIIISAP